MKVLFIRTFVILYVMKVFSNLLQWKVVEFNRNDGTVEIAAVPLKWIKEICHVQYCYWPPSKSRKYIKENKNPEESWNKYEICILSSEPMAYESAIDLERRKEQSTDIEESFMEQNNNKRKCKKRKHPDFVCISTDNDTALDPIPKINLHFPLESLPKINLQHGEIFTDAASNSGEKELNTDADNFVEVYQPLETGENSEVEDQTSNKASETQERPCEVSILDVEKGDFICDKSDEILATLERIERNTAANKLVLERIADKLNCLPNEIVSMTYTTETVPEKPFKKIQKVIDYDKFLRDSEEGRSQLETAFKMCGGGNYNEVIRKGLKRIIDDKLAKKCSWLGRKNNFQVSNLVMIDILKKSVRKTYPSLTDKLFESVVANWLRQANLRYSRKKKLNQ